MQRIVHGVELSAVSDFLQEIVGPTEIVWSLRKLSPLPFAFGRLNPKANARQGEYTLLYGYLAARLEPSGQ
jgi:hypothetical protein